MQMELVRHVGHQQTGRVAHRLQPLGAIGQRALTLVQLVVRFQREARIVGRSFVRSVREAEEQIAVGLLPPATRSSRSSSCLRATASPTQATARCGTRFSSRSRSCSAAIARFAGGRSPKVTPPFREPAASRPAARASRRRCDRCSRRYRAAPSLSPGCTPTCRSAIAGHSRKCPARSATAQPHRSPCRPAGCSRSLSKPRLIARRKATFSGV